MAVDCVLLNVDRMETLRRQHRWSLKQEGVLANVFSLIGLCEGPVSFGDKVTAAFMNISVPKWLELRDDLILKGILFLTDEGHLYVTGEGDLFRFPTHGRKRFPSEVREAAMRRTEGACAYCGKRGDLVLDHVLPIGRGGQDEPSNLVAACHSCNSSKGDKTLLEWTAFLRRGDLQ